MRWTEPLSFLFRGLLADAQLAREAFPDDPEIVLICEVLQLAQGALSYEPSTLAGQLVGFLSSQVWSIFYASILFNRSVIASKCGKSVKRRVSSGSEFFNTVKQDS